ncbi:ubiquitin carboxyl-terminal hydrolase isozyme L3, putative [Plasmodium sp. gorilla clade G2]|uniref:ubiquitin carboxyl-terminal hydrolase isozyme L3, putative n=1 Tax=Plasmodium sp. gorilla clade G2 TaxID=880535 RepID=UPI000D21D6B7|nr:ubiquitin carboxyl-terminal hydrolase isozyme L3, putative [Plasmodium sp. gorilla clade G2]SOV19699.1 ubiquitin carboxyl-terminal hydrolase isozyme L3, putative [Plasmodium sp. gorilla clade G2]
MAKNDIWTPLESNPDSLYLYSCKLGQSKLKFVDIYGFNNDLLDMIPQPVHAVIFLYPLNNNIVSENSTISTIDNQNSKENFDNVWFIKQYIPNSCGTIALLHLYGNLRNKFKLDKDSVLEDFFNKVNEMSAEKRGQELKNNKNIENLHHEFCGQVENREDILDVDTHFIVFVQVEGKLIELDGRKDHPTFHCFTNGDNFLYDTGKIIQDKFIEKCKDDLRFSALAVIPNDNFDII